MNMKRIGIIGGRGLRHQQRLPYSDGYAQVVEQRRASERKYLPLEMDFWLTNEAMDASCYYGEDPEFARNVLGGSGMGTLEFFVSWTFTSRGGYIYPRSDQASFWNCWKRTTQAEVKYIYGVRIRSPERSAKEDLSFVPMARSSLRTG